jgi:Ulp1 family protease
VQVNNYAKSVRDFLKNSRVSADLEAIYEKKEQAKRLEEATERLQNENEITTRDLLARNSKGIALNLRRGASSATTAAATTAAATTSSPTDSAVNNTSSLVPGMYAYLSPRRPNSY